MGRLLTLINVNTGRLCPKFVESRSNYLARNEITGRSHLKSIYGNEEASRAFKKFCEIAIKTKKKL